MARGKRHVGVEPTKYETVNWSHIDRAMREQMARSAQKVEPSALERVLFAGSPGVMAVEQPDAFEITVSEPFPASRVYCGAPGNVCVITAKRAKVTFHNVPAGTILPVKCVQILSKGTTLHYGFVGIGE